MKPQLLIDTTPMLDRMHAPHARGSAYAETTCALTRKRDSKRSHQVKALVVGTLMFLPFLAGYFYFALCANQ